MSLKSLLVRLVLTFALVAALGVAGSATKTYYRVAVGNQVLVDQLKPSNQAAVEVSVYQQYGGDTAVDIISGCLLLVGALLIWVKPVSQALAISSEPSTPESDDDHS